MARILMLLLLLHGMNCIWDVLSSDIPVRDQDPDFWIRRGQEALQKALRLQPEQGVAKNVIIFLGDGMGISTVTSARIYKGQKEGRPGEETLLSFEKFPYVALSKTYNVDYQVPDSAGTATAFLSGVKTNMKAIGVSAKARVSDCDSTFGNEVNSVLQWAVDAGKHTGFVTSTRVSHATPAALYAHSADRDWEYDSVMPANASRCKDITRQLVEDEPGRSIKVILGGGRKTFLTKNQIDKEANLKGLRNDTDLIRAWLKSKTNQGNTASYITNLKEFNSVDTSITDYLLGLFEYDHMQYEADRDNSNKGEPSLAEMTSTAIKMLQKNQNGFFLLVEGGRIDHGHHSSNAMRALEDTIAFDKAVETALNLTSQKDTLILATADHSHVLTVNGYPKRGNPILGIAGVSDVDNLTYTTLMYNNGPGYSQVKDGRKVNLTEQETGTLNYTQITAVPLKFETHGGEDVAVYSVGPMAHLLHGVQEQNYIAHVMGYAACIGQNQGLCSNKPKKFPQISGRNSASDIQLSRFLHILVLVSVYKICSLHSWV